MSLTHTHIEGKESLLKVNLKEVWRYRDLVWMYTRRIFLLQYKQTVLGPLWVFINPLMSSIIYAFVFGGIAGIETDGVPGILFYLCSNAVWIMFSGCVNRNAQTFTANAHAFSKVYFPRLVVPVSNMLACAIQFAIQMTLVLCFLAYYLLQGAVQPNWVAWVYIPLVVLQLGLLGIGVGIIISSLTTKYRDLVNVITYGVQLWMYATPIVYPLSQLEDGFMKTVLLINPVTMPTEIFRYAVVGQGTILPEYVILSVAVTLVVTFLGVVLFNRVEKTFVDTV